jgi:hypothetical protein
VTGREGTRQPNAAAPVEVENLDRMLADLDELRRSLSERIWAWIERA